MPTSLQRGLCWLMIDLCYRDVFSAGRHDIWQVTFSAGVGAILIVVDVKRQREGAEQFFVGDTWDGALGHGTGFSGRRRPKAWPARISGYDWRNSNLVDLAIPASLLPEMRRPRPFSIELRGVRLFTSDTEHLGDSYIS